MDSGAAKPDGRGQGAMEYLMNYGWAILAVLVVGIMLWQLGYMDMHPETITVSGFRAVKPQIAGLKFTTTGHFECVFTNAAGETIQVTDFTVTRDAVNHYGITNNAGCGRTQSHISTNDVPCYRGDSLVLTPAVIPKGENFRVHIAPNAGERYTEGDSYKLNVTMSYFSTISGSQTTHTETGIIKATYQRN